MDTIETELRAAFIRKVASLPDDAGDTLRSHEYPPRAGGRRAVAAACLVTAGVGAAVVAVALRSAGHALNQRANQRQRAHGPAGRAGTTTGTVQLGPNSMVLAGRKIRLPDGLSAAPATPSFNIWQKFFAKASIVDMGTAPSVWTHGLVSGGTIVAIGSGSGQPTTTTPTGGGNPPGFAGPPPVLGQVRSVDGDTVTVTPNTGGPAVTVQLSPATHYWKVTQNDLTSGTTIGVFGSTNGSNGAVDATAVLLEPPPASAETPLFFTIEIDGGQLDSPSGAVNQPVGSNQGVLVRDAQTGVEELGVQVPARTIDPSGPAGNTEVVVVALNVPVAEMASIAAQSSSAAP